MIPESVCVATWAMEISRLLLRMIGAPIVTPEVLVPVKSIVAVLAPLSKISDPPAVELKLYCPSS